MTLDLSTARGVLNYAQRQRDSMVDEWRKEGRFERNGFSYGAILFCTHGVQRNGPRPEDWTSGSKLPAVKAVPVSLPRDIRGRWGGGMPGHTTEREFFAHGVKTFARLAKAIGCLTLAECWFSSPGTPFQRDATFEEREKAKREAQAFRDALPDDLGDAPPHQRWEGLWVRLEHTGLTWPHSWMARIHRDPTRLDPWDGGEMQLDDATGRLANLVEWRS